MVALGEQVRDADYARGYFGELIRGLTKEQRNSAERGFRLFARVWPEGAGARRNAESCVSCHSVPMPGGSGMSQQALVPIDTRAQPGSRDELVQVISPIERHATGAVRRTPALFGVGYLEFLLRKDSNSPSGPFGAFGTVRRLDRFIARAFASELGVSSSLECARPLDADGIPEQCLPTISDADLASVVDFVRYLAPPPRQSRPATFAGEALFDSIGCTGCHEPVMVTRRDAPSPLESRKVIAYTDMAAHDMGKRAPIVTRALWGLNSVGPPYMHDACGSTLVEAITCHGGEGRRSASRFNSLSGMDQQAILEFLRGL